MILVDPSRKMLIKFAGKGLDAPAFESYVVPSPGDAVVISDTRYAVRSVWTMGQSPGFKGTPRPDLSIVFLDMAVPR